MINPHTQRPRRSLANVQKVRDNFPITVGPNALSAYNKLPSYQTVKPITHRPKGKQNKKQRKSIRNDQFSDFAIKFRNEIFESNKINQSFTSRNYAENELSQSFGRIHFYKQNIQQVRSGDNMRFQQKNIDPAERDKANIRSSSKNTMYLSLFNQALCKIFKSLDVFNRGRISETNINKWIPESALYFLGGIFQKIKQERLTLNYAEFEVLCQPLLNQSTEQDIKWFIEEVSGKEAQLNISIDMIQEQKGRENSPVIMKLNNFTNNLNNHYIQKPRQRFEHSNSNRKQPLKHNPSPILFQKVLNNIKVKEKQLNIRFNSIKEKRQSDNSVPKDQYSQFSFFNSHTNPPNTQLNNEFKDLKEAKIEKSSKKTPIPNMNDDYLIKSYDKSDKQVPNFTFQIPKQPSYFENIKIDAKWPQKRSNPSDYQRESSAPKTSRIVRQSIPKQITYSSSKKPRNNSQQPDKIDRLNSRLEQYIKFNKQKLQQNKNFIKENSLPRK